jgi:sec-independent protein translocase protein TatC
MTLVEHLEELRRRIIVSLVAVAIGVVGALIAKNAVFAVVERPLRSLAQTHPDLQLLTFSPTEPFMTVFQVCFFTGLLVALPVILWELWAFILPALHENEGRAVLPYVALTAGLFLFGVVFGYFLVLPIGLAWLMNVGGSLFQQELRASEYISFFTLFLLAFGLVFEMPVVLLMLSGLGVVNSRMLRKNRKWAVVINGVVAAVATPSQDPLSMILMMIPLVILYELTIMMIQGLERRRERRMSQADAGLAG